jgi:hypothetical protein
VEYLNSRDATIMGSRNGHAPIYMWCVVCDVCDVCGVCGAAGCWACCLTCLAWTGWCSGNAMVWVAVVGKPICRAGM